MNPDKLFDYLDGKLSPADRQQLEEKLMSDSQLRKQFGIAREIHRGGGSREVVVQSDDAETVRRSGILGRRIATAAFVLVILNVAAGLAVISWNHKKVSSVRQREANVRPQIEESVDAAARNALPAASLTDDEINLAAPRAEWDRLASAIIAAAQAAGGSAIREDREGEIILTASIPRARLLEFRKQVLGPTAVAANKNEVSGNPATVQVRIAE